jgi:hypothetical protein
MDAYVNYFGNLSARVADTLVTNARFDRVILVPIAIGSTKVADWATGDLSSRFQVTMLRLASRGITPATTEATFGGIFGDGEDDNLAGTSQAVAQTERDIQPITFIPRPYSVGAIPTTTTQRRTTSC